MKHLKSYLVISLIIAGVINVCAQDWPQIFGPNRNNISPQKGLLRSWPEKGPQLLWSVDVGPGYGGPVVKDGKVYLLDRVDDAKEIMRCFDLNTGKELWKFEYDAPGKVDHPGSRSVPTADGNYVYSVGHNGDLYCFDVNTHKPVWQKNLMKDFGGTKLPVWAITQSPLIYGDLLIVAYSKDPYAGLVAYNKRNGNIVWQTDAIGNETYASPAIAKIGGEDHIVMVFSSTNTFMHRNIPTSSGKIIGLKPQTGAILWEYNNWTNVIQIPLALDIGDGRIIVVGGYDHGVVMIQVQKSSDGKYNVKELFYHTNFGDHTKPPIFYNNHFYAQYSTNNKRDGLVCMDINGNVLWKTMREPLFDKGSMILADGLILATDGRQTLYLIEPDPAGFKPLASAQLLGEGQNWSPMALVDGKLLLRDQSKMICVKVAR
ncbi:MAG TPA: PQQ-binding-like beta-propeller repeat protein [Bacteroidales bacterium]|nr:PQQ-binding-like beta-propeller repeat protein [Bacteroidales bacterium]HOK74113.1 PQQ-binding-like beta-propeller repeat protein [Bacteroidales bacterium]HOM40493.1 PQQ-binding-like beta-propeller repeat protein [Bacteroidales bacterium]HPP92557.1 PQQ-binding-like beta-propeller repeat protein [Bacteroidales bacterium]HQK70869.1 PQQ-binding-like beta-propeller repeat protein [Bacteroidales bacterium]